MTIVEGVPTSSFLIFQNIKREPKTYFRSDEATEILFRILKLADYSDPKVLFFAAVHADKIGHNGRALKLIQVTITKP
jgi:hypothetical protein